jgi:ribonuclease D
MNLNNFVSQKFNVYKNDIPENLMKSEIMAIDTETMGLNLNRDRLCVLQFSFGDGRAHMVHFDGIDYSAPNLKKFLEDENIIKVFHYARFDLLAIRKYLGISLENIYCTKIASRLARTYTDRHSLNALVFEVSGQKLDKMQQCSNWGVENLSQAQIEYAAYDVLYLHQIKKKLDEMLKISGRYELAMDCFAFLPVRAELDDLGWDDIFRHSDFQRNED